MRTDRRLKPRRITGAARRIGLSKEKPRKIIALLDAGELSQAEIGRRLKVTRQYVNILNKWRQQVLEQAEAR